MKFLIVLVAVFITIVIADDSLVDVAQVCKKIENFTILIPKENSYCRHKSSARGPPFKISPEGLSTETDILIRSPMQVQTEADVAEPQCTRWLTAAVCQ